MGALKGGSPALSPVANVAKGGAVVRFESVPQRTLAPALNEMPQYRILSDLLEEGVMHRKAVRHGFETQDYT